MIEIQSGRGKEIQFTLHAEAGIQMLCTKYLEISIGLDVLLNINSDINRLRAMRLFLHPHVTSYVALYRSVVFVCCQVMKEYKIKIAAISTTQYYPAAITAFKNHL